MDKRARRLLVAVLACAFALSWLLLAACSPDGILGDDDRADHPVYHGDEKGNYTFLLELRDVGSGEEVAEGDAFAHSTTDGSLIKSWTVPYFGNTVYEAVVKFFEGKEDTVTFRLSQHKFYMFHDCTADGKVYDLETAYIAADGVYANCANFEKLCGDDGQFGTDDDLKILTLVYRGWVY